jgi:hypothetical protein
LLESRARAVGRARRAGRVASSKAAPCLPVCRLMPPVGGDFCRQQPPDLEDHAATSESRACLPRPEISAIDFASIRGILALVVSTRASGRMTLQIGWLHEGANWQLSVSPSALSSPLPATDDRSAGGSGRTVPSHTEFIVCIQATNFVREGRLSCARGVAAAGCSDLFLAAAVCSSLRLPVPRCVPVSGSSPLTPTRLFLAAAVCSSLRLSVPRCGCLFLAAARLGLAAPRWALLCARPDRAERALGSRAEMKIQCDTRE